LDSINEHLMRALVRGHDADADFVIVLDHQQGELVCWLLVGNSAVCGDEAMSHIAEALGGDMTNAEEMITKVATAMGPQLHAPDGVLYCPMRDETSSRWRAFRGNKPMSIDAVRNRAKAQASGNPSTN